MKTTGNCLCKNTAWEFEGEVSWCCYCHCDDCRRNCAAPIVAWLGVPVKNFKWVGDTPKSYQSSPGVLRHFCNTCGSPLGFEAEHYEGGMHLYAASMEEPDKFKPSFHVNYHSKLEWLEIHDELKKYDSTLLHAPTKLGEYD